jgi:polyribonucleotide 5'-hydroxyl-kinase
MIIGPEDAGKTSLTKLLTGYAIRQGRAPCVVNLDPKEGMLSLPGTLTATNFSSIMDVEEGFGTSPTNGPSPVPVKLPLVYYYGLEDPETNEKLYRKLVSRMAVAVSSRLSEDDESSSDSYILA